ncbi:MAG: hypothetical protein ACFFCP_04820 [Promethearchaeota archaeon]
MEDQRKRVFVLTLMILLGSPLSIINTIDGENCEGPRDDARVSQTSEYPPFQPPAYNASTLDSGSLMINGQEIFWRYFFPNTSIIQPKNFRFSFEIWWANPDPDIVIMVDLSENVGDSNATSYYETLLAYEKILETPDGEFIHYAVWMNSTYFFMNETWASFGNEFIDEESLNLTVGIQHYTYFPIFEYTILRDTTGPSIQIIHPNYDESENKLVLDWSNTSFQIIIASRNSIKSVKFNITILNTTTFEPQEFVVWNPETSYEGGESKSFIPSLIATTVDPDHKGVDGLLDIDISNPISASLVVVDGYGYATSKSVSIVLKGLYSNTTTTTLTGGDWSIMIPIIGSASIVCVAGILLVIKRMKK